LSTFVIRDLTRRDFLRFARDAAAAVALGSLPASGGERTPRFQSSPFRFGVASGDPLPGSVVLWTRLDSQVLDRSGAQALHVPVRWEISDDDGFRHIVRKGSHLAVAELGHSVHVEIDGLHPGRHYWYRFMAGGETSAEGRTRTAPAASATVDQLRFAFVSCQNYETGYFTAYRRIVEEDLDLVVHLGDYIYETGTMGSERAVRLQEAGGELLTLDQYRARYASYKTDPDLQAAHASFPFVVTPDDHEVKNDYAGATAPGDIAAEPFLLRRAAAYQAYYEFMPLRRSSLPAGPFMRLFRRQAFGCLAEFHVLDTRQYRPGLSCGGGRKPLCEEALSPSQNILGTNQERWLMDGLHASSARWNLIANQVLISQLVQGAGGTRTFSMDNWNGYPQSRTRLMRFLADARPANPVVLTGDIHSNWVSDLKLDFDDPTSETVGTELVGTAISSGGDGDESTRADALAQNPHFKFYNNRRGYVRCTVSPSLLAADFRTLPYVTRPDAPIETRASFVVENGRPGAQLVKMGDPQ
jgi:alkaline phosphatase D